MYTNWKGGKLKRLRSRSTSCGGNLNEERREGGRGRDFLWKKHDTHLLPTHVKRSFFPRSIQKRPHIWCDLVAVFIGFFCRAGNWLMIQAKKTCLCPYNKRLCIQYFNTFLAWNNFRGPEKSQYHPLFPRSTKKSPRSQKEIAPTRSPNSLLILTT